MPSGRRLLRVVHFNHPGGFEPRLTAGGGFCQLKPSSTAFRHEEGPLSHGIRDRAGARLRLILTVAVLGVTCTAAGVVAVLGSQNLRRLELVDSRLHTIHSEGSRSGYRRSLPIL